MGESPDGLLCFFLQDKGKAAFKRGWIAGQKKIKSEDGENSENENDIICLTSYKK